MFLPPLLVSMEANELRIGVALLQPTHARPLPHNSAL
jgi:hypothetical protein